MLERLLRGLLARLEAGRPLPSPTEHPDPAWHEPPTALMPQNGPAPAPVRPNAPFTVRVRALVEVVAQADEVAKARWALEENGWSVREATPEERTGVADDRVGLVVDGRLYGSRWWAEKAAVAALTRLAGRRTLALVVRDAVLVTVEDEPRVGYRVVRAFGPAGRLRGILLRLWARCGGRNLHRLAHVPAGHTREQIQRELETRRLGDHRLPAGEYELVPAPPADAAEAARRLPGTLGRGRQALAVAGLLVAVAGGFLSHDRAWPLALVIVVPAFLIGAFAAFPARDRSTPVVIRALLSGGVSGFLVYLGGALGGAMPDDDGSTTLLTAVFVVFTAPGVYFALRGSWVARHATLLVTLATPVAWAAVRWLGRLMQSAYLDTFGIPSEAVRATADFWHYAAVAEPVLVALGFTLLFTAAYGWLRHVHFAVNTDRIFALTMTVLLSVLYALTAISVGLAEADGAAERAAERAEGGHDPAPYFGLEGALMCVRPVRDEPLAVENGPVPTDHPVLSFGASGDWIWLWDPERDGPRKAFVVLRSGVQLVPPDRTAAGGPTCPRSAG